MMGKGEADWEKGRLYMTQDELLFFDRHPQMLPLYQAVGEELEKRGLAYSVKVSKTQISLRNRYVFAAVSLPWRRGKGWPEEYLLVSFGLSYQKVDSRIAVAAEPYPNRWTHHVLLTRREDVDDTLMEWLEEAYRFSMEK